MLSNCCTQYVSKSGRPSSGHRTGKGQSLSQFPRRVVPKNVLTIGQLHSSPIVRSCWKSCMLGFSITWNKNFQTSKLGLGKTEEPEMKLPTFVGSQRKQGNFRKTSTSVSSTMLKPLTVWITTNCGKLLKRREYQTILLVSWETCMQVRTQQLEPCLYGTSNWFRTEKGVWQSCLLSPCLFNLYDQHIMRKTGLNELQAGIKIGGRNINNLQFSLLAQSLHDPLDCSMPGFPVHQQLQEIQVHWVGDAV